MKSALVAVIFALSATAVFAAPAGWDRPGGYHDQIDNGSLSNPVAPCSPVSPTVVDTNGSEPGGQYIIQCGHDPIPVSIT